MHEVDGRRTVGAVSGLCRLGLSAVWLVSGLIKAADPQQTEVAVRAYQLLPSSLVEPVALALPFTELGLGVLLLLGVGVRPVAVASAGLLVVLLGAVASAWVRGLGIDCGCFGGGGVADVGPADYLAEMGRDAGFLLLAAWLALRPRSPLAVGPGSRTGPG